MKALDKRVSFIASEKQVSKFVRLGKQRFTALAHRQMA